MAIKRHITHIKSNDVIEGSPKLPQASDLLYGEIAVNYADGYETITIKNDGDSIATFTNDEYWENKIDKTPCKAEYDSDDEKIYFKNENDEILSSMTINAQEFIVDGMINSVTLESGSTTTYLVITWNTDAGKEETRLDVGDIFEVDNYYTKDEIDEVTSSTTETIAAALVYLNKVKSNVSDLTEHANDSTIHITAQEREKWNNGGYIETTYSDLKTLRDNSGLTKGAFYRITDYVTTTTQADTQSAGNQFDVVVFATDVNKLNENAYAVQHQGDTYFANSKLDAWKLKYCLDNDATRFAWADSTNGKGVIYYMKDEFNNECPYDFKNIQYVISQGAGYFITFTFDNSGNDASIIGLTENVYSNVIKEYFQDSKQKLNVIYFRGTSSINNGCCYNSFGNGCNHITFNKEYSQYNIIENGNQYITLTSTQTTGSSAKLQNITIAQGVNNTTTMKTISHDTVNDAFKTTYQMSQSRIVDL